MRKLSIVILTVLFFLSCKSQPQSAKTEIIDPEFDVISIYVIQADIVVTEFEAVIKINNPNDFALELSSIAYQLYGNGRLWASGTGNNLRSSDSASKPRSADELFQIPANGTGEARFFFSMNFTNMSRALLDDVIKMNKVNYRFKGEADIRPALKGIPPFKASFDCSGLSDVKRRAD